MIGTEIERVVWRCEANHLIFEHEEKLRRRFRTWESVGDHSPEVTHDEPINRVCSHKCTGVHFNNTFRWKARVESLSSRLQHKLYFLRRLRVYGVNQRIMFLFYQALLESIVLYGMSAWYDSPTVLFKCELARLVTACHEGYGEE